MITPTIAIVGAGNMGLTLLRGLLHAHYPHNKIWATLPSAEKCDALKKQFSIHATTNNVIAIKSADIVILAVKPQILPSVIHELKPSLQARKPLIISIAAGVTIKSLEQGLGEKGIPIIRSMPNTPLQISAGATGLFANTHVSASQKKHAESIFLNGGLTVWLEEEKLIEVVSALSGSGPAYFFLLMEALMEAGEKCGLSKDVARLLTLKTAEGAARMAFQSDDTVVALRRAVTSPAGTTEQAIRVMEEASIRKIMLDALMAAQKRSVELSALFQEKMDAL